MILQDNLTSFQQLAENIPNYKKANKNDLCRSYVACQDEYLKSCYLSAIICKYWHKLSSFYNRSKPAATMEDCYNWLIDSIMISLQQHKWDDEDSSLYGRKEGPDIAINVRMNCLRATFFQQSLAAVRRVALNTFSFDDLSDDVKQDYIPFIGYEEQDLTYYTEMICNYISHKKYMLAFILDTIIHDNCFALRDGDAVFDRNKCAQIIRSRTDEYIFDFADTYSCNLLEIKKQFEIIKKMSPAQIKGQINDELYKLQFTYGGDYT